MTFLASFILIAAVTPLTADLQVLNPSKSAVVPTGGPIVGQTVKTSAGTVADIYLGIPYGEPPVGDLRFRSPVPRKKWSQPLQCQKYAPACPQNTTFGQHLVSTEKSEDCLFLNVFTGPSCKKSNPCAVIYYVHGGVNEFDSPRGFPPEFLIDNWVSRNITFVTPAYRLGVLGFWSTGTPDAPGNYALRDILLGAQWIKDNIHIFGGNGSQITAVGYSSSAGLISLLTLSPLTAGVFQQAALVSGTGFWPSYVNHTTPVPRYEFVAQEVGCAAKWTKWDASSTPQITACMRNMSAEKLVEAFIHPRDEDKLEFYGNPANFMKPGADGCASIIDGPGGVLPEPFEVLVSKRKPVPLMLGTTTKEWAYQLYNLSALLHLPANASTAVLKTFCAFAINKNLVLNPAQMNTIVDRCFEFYQKRFETIAAQPPNPLDAKHSPLDLTVLELYNDVAMYAPIFADASSMRTSFGPLLDQSRDGATPEVPVYLYEFAYAEPGQEWYQPYHAFDLRFLSGNGMAIGSPTPRSEQMHKMYVDLYANFAKFGNPTPPQANEVKGGESNHEKSGQQNSHKTSEETLDQENVRTISEQPDSARGDGNANDDVEINVNVNVNVHPQLLTSTASKSGVSKWAGLAYPSGFNYHRIDLPASEMRSDYHTAAVLFWNGLVSTPNEAAVETRLAARQVNLVELDVPGEHEKSSMSGWQVILLAASATLGTAGVVSLLAYSLTSRRKRSSPLLIKTSEKSLNHSYKTFTL